ncbi:hypothetical protein DPMN_082964 [Dreissena polymorpha]|uniref:Mitogen-activated protein kinase kinase kinase 1 n=1 Tax=Dreissena polymorpha TaxID=45954 RepID=A0A9D3YBJ4_DREPO|nr:hypothetical protein DPMN_082964 [Dreissena polymorpha]
MVRRESSGRRNPVVRRNSSGKSKKMSGSESPSAPSRKKSFRASGGDNAFTHQIVNDNVVLRKGISPANSFRNLGTVRRTPSDKVLDPNDPATKKLVERVRRSRLYLLRQMGPNSFQIVGDSPDHKFKVIIGPQSCSCGKSQHCVHVLFVMLRVFQVAESDPNLWSKKLKNYEVESLFRMYHSKRSMKIQSKSQRRLRKRSPGTSQTPSSEETPVPSESDAGSVREEDDTCPICLLEMLEGESLLNCLSCQNKLHLHCITVWFEECRRMKEPLICPLCRAHWKQANVEPIGEETVTEPPMAPPNTRVPSPTLELEPMRMPYAEPIPSEFAGLAAPWIEVFGEDLATCMFSRNWSIRETGLKHLASEMSRDLMSISRGNSTGNSMSNVETLWKLLEYCFKVVAHLCNDPVYRVFVGCLKVVYTVFGLVPLRDVQQKYKLQLLFKPVIEAIIVKCTDGNKRTGELSISTMLEIAKGQNGELALGRNTPNPGQHGLGGMSYLVSCLTEKYDPCQIPWPWLLGRLYIIERLVTEFSTEFLPRQQPDGASSESSIELIGATSNSEEDEKPQNYDRLFIVAEFAIQAVSNQHARISRVAKRVFLLAARYAAHLENLINEFNNLLNNLDFSHKKSLKRQLEKIVSDFRLSEQLGRHLHSFVNEESPEETPLSSPKCTSPITVTPDNQSEIGKNALTNFEPIVPPNTPIRHIDQQSNENERADKIGEQKDGVYASNTLQRKSSYYRKLKMSKSLDDLDSIEKTMKSNSRRRKSKSPLGTLTKSNKSRSRSRTPNRIGPVLETDLDEVIKQEEARKRRNSGSRRTSIEDDDDDCDDDIASILSPSSIFSSSESYHPIRSRLLSHDLETDIDSVEPDIDMLIRNTRRSCDDLLKATEDYCDAQFDTPHVKLPKLPKSLSLDLDGAKRFQKNKRSISPCAHAFEVERLSVLRDSTEMESATKNSHKSQTPVTCSVKKSTSTTKTDPSYNGVEKSDSKIRSRGCTNSSRRSSTQDRRRSSASAGVSDTLDDCPDYMAQTPCTDADKPVTFQTEVAMVSTKRSHSQALENDGDDYPCKEEVEKEEALALARAMEVSSHDPPTPVVPGLTPLDQEQVITIRIQPEECDGMDSNGNPPMLYFENVHWVKGRQLGSGAFSTCYQSRDVKTGTIMALKQISFCRNYKSEQDKVIETITEEIHMMSKLSHPNIVRLLGATRQGCHFNMFVEWMPGGSVASLLATYGRFSEEVMISYMLQVLRGIAFLHDKQVLHRDLKGANLLVDSTGQRVRIGDFGSAAKLASRATGAGEFMGQLLGTIAFMAPEVLRGENYGRACDVWSAGCCLIEMATTKPPWNAHDISNHLALIFKIAKSQSSPPIPENLSPPLRDLVLRCLEPIQDQRQSAKELLIHPLFTQYMQRKS